MVLMMRTTLQYFIILCGVLFILICFFTFIYYSVNKGKYNEIISLYRREGLFIPAFYNFMTFSGYLGSCQVVLFFYTLLAANEKRINGKDSKFLSPQCYDFIKQLPKELTGWMKYYLFLNILGFIVLAIGFILMSIDKHINTL
ncbi:Uncharacterised protein [Yersinia aldovae]|uniref:Uncharacterized protein n=3 Tax=Yersinia aldovae TaxID=29483 RepID=A0ABM9SUN8_YERAL|nr:Uncharacterised protein [Yersinia aldovae]